MKYIVLLFSVLYMAGCGSGSPQNRGSSSASLPPPPVAPVSVLQPDNSVIHGQAFVNVGMSNDTAMLKIFRSIFPYAYASSGSVNVTYINSPSTTFTINANNLVASGFTGTTLNLGSVTVSSLSDNNLKVCGSGNSKCVTGIMRVYTTGSTAGFVNTADSYGVPVYVGTLNPVTPLGLNSLGSVQVELHTIPNTQHTISLSDFASPTYSVTSDFSNAGAGTYNMVFVVEYALQ